MNSAPTTRSLLRRSFTYGAVGAAYKAIALFSVPYLSRALGPAEYGLADLATSLAALLTLVVNFSADIPAARLRGQTTSESARRQVYGTYVLLTLAVSVGVAALIGPAAPAIASFLWGMPNATPLAVGALVLVPVSALQVAFAAIQRLESRSGKFAALMIVDLTAQVGLAVLLVALGLGPAGVVLGFILGSTVGLTAAVISARRDITLSRQLTEARYFLLTGMQFLPAIVGFVFADQITRLVAAIALSTTDVGYLAVGFRIASVMSLATTAFSLAWGPMALSLSEGATTDRLFGHFSVRYVVVMGAGALVVGALAPEIAVVVSGAEFRPAAVLIPGLALSAALVGELFLLGTVAGVAERSRIIGLPIAIGALVQVVMAWALVPSMNLAGLGIAVVAGPLSAVFLLGTRLRGRLRTSWQWLLLAVAVSAIGAIWLQVANVTPDDTILARIAVAIAATAAVAAGISLRGTSGQ